MSSNKIFMDEPACCRCGKKYYENTLEVKKDEVRCTSCSSIPKYRERGIASNLYYRYKSEYGLTLLGRHESILISKLK